MRHIIQWFSAVGATLASWGPWGVFLLAFIDSAGIPVSVGMDALIILLGARAPERVWLGATLAVIGSLAGNVLLFLLARRGGARFMQRTPQPGKPAKFREWFERYGLVTVFVPALVPIPLPLKVFVVSAGVLRTPLLPFVLVVLAARVIRYYGEAWLGLKLGEESADFLRRHVWELLGLAAGLFAFIYLLMRRSDRRRMRS